MKNKQILWIGLSAVVLGTTAFFIYDAFNKNSSSNKLNDNSSSNNLNAGETSQTNTVFPLKLGSKGFQVKALQKFLNNSNSLGLEIDGIFGPLTLKSWLSEQLCDSVINTNTDCWKQYKTMYKNAEPGKVDLEFYNTNIKDKF